MNNKSKPKRGDNFQIRIICYALQSLLITVMIGILAWGMIQLGIYVLGEQNHNQQNSYLNEENRNAETNRIMNYSLTGSPKEQNEVSHNDTGRVIINATITVTIGVIIFMVVFLYYIRRYYRYIDEITEGIERIAHGDFETKIPVRYSDEMSYLAETVNHLSVSIQKMIAMQKENEQSKNELITSVAHDLRTPLTSIIGYLELARRDTVTDEKTRQNYIKVAFTKAERLQTLIEDLFTYTQFSFGKVTLRNSKLDMVKFLEQIAEEFYPLFKENDLLYTFHTNVKKAFVCGDGDLLYRVFANLYSNAVKYGKSGERIETYLEENEEDIKIRIVNYGQLIPKEDIEHIFERFYRVDNSRSGQTGGSGLGLAIAKNIITMHGGTIEAESNIGGTTFTVTMNRYKEIG